MPNTKNLVRETNFQNAQTELVKVVQYLESVQKLYFKPMRLTEENNATTKAIGYINRSIQRLTKRIQLSQAVNKQS